jgi:hypothetical protein
MEIRTRGQHENPLWYKVRKGRITASIFHDVLTRKSNTPPQKLVERIVGNWLAARHEHVSQRNTPLS